jgi:hypothetical protein
MQILLGGADRLIGRLQHREVEALLVAEVVIDHPLVDARRLGDGIDTRAGQAFRRELGRGRRQDRGARAFGVARDGAPR